MQLLALGQEPAEPLVVEFPEQRDPQIDVPMQGLPARGPVRVFQQVGPQDRGAEGVGLAHDDVLAVHVPGRGPREAEPEE